MAAIGMYICLQVQSRDLQLYGNLTFDEPNLVVDSSLLRIVLKLNGKRMNGNQPISLFLIMTWVVFVGCLFVS